MTLLRLPLAAVLGFVLGACLSSSSPEDVASMRQAAPVPPAPDAGPGCPQHWDPLPGTATCSYSYDPRYSDTGSTCSTYIGYINDQPATFYRIQCNVQLACTKILSGDTNTCQGRGLWLYWAGERPCAEPSGIIYYPSWYTSSISGPGDCPEDVGSVCTESAATSNQPMRCESDAGVMTFSGTCCSFNPASPFDAGTADAGTD